MAHITIYWYISPTGHDTWCAQGSKLHVLDATDHVLPERPGPSVPPDELLDDLEETLPWRDLDWALKMSCVDRAADLPWVPLTDGRLGWEVRR